MKKYFIFAVAAIAAMAACTKVDIDENLVPDQKISFEVGNYAPQTKANTALNASDGDNIWKFYSVAYQFPQIGDPVKFMDTDVLAWNGTTSGVTSGTVTTWAPAKDYYWPKTGFINFYSYAGKLAGSVVGSGYATADAQKTTITLDFGTAASPKTIQSTDNLLVAKPALHYNTNATQYISTSGVTSGVPTLFKHQLAKLTIKAKLKTTQTASNNTIWSVRILNAASDVDATLLSQITIKNTGYLQMVSDDSYTNRDTYMSSAASCATTWTVNTTATGVVSGWIPDGTAAAETINLTNMASADALTIPVNSQVSASDFTILAERTVMPQLTANTTLTLYYLVEAKHSGETDPFLREVRTVGVNAGKTLADAAASIAQWEANTKVTYYIVIDPVSEKVTFDPAVEEWGTANDVDTNIDFGPANS